LTHIFRFFTQGDIDVAGAYVNNYLPVFPAPEVRMMLSSFAAREAIHNSVQWIKEQGMLK
jgi:ribonucleoside-diphosphate reductase beta chain